MRLAPAKTVSLCEAAGYDLIFVETVGVGQSEEQVASLVDCVLLVLLAGAGDEISSMKRGILEAADVIAFNKADGERSAAVHSDAAALRANLTVSHGQTRSRPCWSSAHSTTRALQNFGTRFARIRPER